MGWGMENRFLVNWYNLYHTNSLGYWVTEHLCMEAERTSRNVFISPFDLQCVLSGLFAVIGHSVGRVRCLFNCEFRFRVSRGSNHSYAQHGISFKKTKRISYLKTDSDKKMAMCTARNFENSFQFKLYFVYRRASIENLVQVSLL